MMIYVTNFNTAVHTDGADCAAEHGCLFVVRPMDLESKQGAVLSAKIVNSRMESGVSQQTLKGLHSLYARSTWFLQQSVQTSAFA